MDPEVRERLQKQLKDLTAPFAPEDVRTRPQAGQNLSYITARHVENRLDGTVGVQNWWDDYEQVAGGIVCKLTLRFADGTVVTKIGAGASDDTPDEGNNFKAGFSDAFKRAAARFGIGRYLYRDGVPGWHTTEPAKPFLGDKKSSLPPQTTRGQQPSYGGGGQGGGGYPLSFSIPENPARYFGWIKDLEKHFQANLLNVTNAYCEGRQYPTNTKQWNPGVAQEIFEDMIEHIRGLPSYKGEFGDQYTPPAQQPQPQPQAYSSPAPQPTGGDDIPF